jgi:glycosyltransferase involved in cell wall biosynthesis
MKIIYLHQYFNTPAQGGSLRSYHLAKALVRAGIEVEMITTHSARKYKHTGVEGISVHYLPIPYHNSFNPLQRVWAFLRFLWGSYRLAGSIRQVDGVFATSTPLSVGIVAYRLRKREKIPYIFEVRDLWPRAPIALGFLKNKLLQKSAYQWEKRIYQNAEKIIALSPMIAADIRQKAPEKEVITIPNMADCGFFKYERKAEKLIQKYHTENQFIITYFGTIGLANHLEYLIAIADYFQQKGVENVQFWIVGKGGKWAEILQKAEELSLKNIRFFAHTATQNLAEMLNQTDAVYISYWDKPVLETSSPNKFFDALACGKLCAVNVQGWLKDLVEQNQCGFYANPHYPAAFYESLKPYLSDAGLLKKAQENARNLAEKEFSVQDLSHLFVTTIKKAFQK